MSEKIDMLINKTEVHKVPHYSKTTKITPRIKYIHN